MTPPEADVAGTRPNATTRPPAVSVCLTTLTKRADFLRAARAKRQASKGFVLQARKRAPGEGESGAIRIGYTCSKKVGNAVARNRAKRRLRAIARAVLPTDGQPGWDYVVIGRAETTASHPYLDMERDLKRALQKIHGNPT
ncbi:MAG: ribonuclease P protein component [Confluentimicrobium sp.]|uniref:ribonuclease P protein component n=1 Tax=Actibacterium sp. TaxID=1872125 RepID=UPI000C63F0EE|nr:ribonuclease P protein component [Actibacterium sp.]MBC56228.1 ribonuclease P protein component [Actibacterium sp.]